MPNWRFGKKNRLPGSEIVDRRLDAGGIGACLAGPPLMEDHHPTINRKSKNKSI